MAHDTPSAFPLQWPKGKPRTKHRARGAFRGKSGSWSTDPVSGANRWNPPQNLTVAQAVARVQRELDRLGARLPVISSNLELRLDGLPRSGQRKPEDPGVAVYFRLDGEPVTLACDRYDTVEANIAAIAAHIDAMRTAERHGVGSLREMFRGFMALPSAEAFDWRDVLGDCQTWDEAKSKYRELARKAHPDAGGSETEFARLSGALEKAQGYFNGN